MAQSKKVLLVKCLDVSRRDVYAFKQIPLGIAYLAASLKGKCDLQVFDMLVDDGLEKTVMREQPDIIGLSIFSVDFVSVRDTINRVRQIAPQALIVAGGAHATSEPLQVLKSGVDLIVRGEGDNALAAIVAKHDGTMNCLNTIPSISFLDGGYLHNIPAELESNIDNFPMPAFEVFDRNKYTQYPLFTSRGCPYGCKYCASKTIWGQRVRFHSAERVNCEIKRAVEQYGVKNLVFIDDTFTLNHSRLFEVCDYIIQRGYDITWSVNSRVDTIDRKVAEKIANANCKVVSFGIETGSEFLQDRIGKKIKLTQMKEAVAACRDYGIRVKTGWMIGLPPGNYAEQMKSLDVMLELEPDEITIHHFIPMPGTPYWLEPERYGIRFEKERILRSFNIDSLPSQLGLSFDYITNEEIEEVTQKIVESLQSSGYKRPGEISSYGLKSKVVNTYMDRDRLPVLPSSK